MKFTRRVIIIVVIYVDLIVNFKNTMKFKLLTSLSSIKFENIHRQHTCLSSAEV